MAAYCGKDRAFVNVTAALLLPSSAVIQTGVDIIDKLETTGGLTVWN